MKHVGKKFLLNESITTAASSFVFLKLDKFEFAEWFKDILDIILSDTEMNVTNIQPVKRRRCRLPTASFRVAGQSILLRFGQLSNDRNS